MEAFLIAHWGVITAYLLGGTMLTKILDAAAKKIPSLAPTAALVDEFATDVWDIAAAVAKVIGQPFSGPPS